jgi:response regulator of citrate/malate metabolism
MTLNGIKTLIAVEDSAMAATIAHHLVTTFEADINIVDSIDDARELFSTTTFDLILADENLRDGRAVSLFENAAIMPGSLILFAERLQTRDVLQALRLGVADYLERPVDLVRLTSAITKASQTYKRRNAESGRAARLRKLSSKLVKDRRELRQRVDLLCRDLVQAYRRLAEKVVSLQAEDSTHE